MVKVIIAIAIIILVYLLIGICVSVFFWETKGISELLHYTLVWPIHVLIYVVVISFAKKWSEELYGKIPKTKSKKAKDETETGITEKETLK